MAKNSVEQVASEWGRMTDREKTALTKGLRSVVNSVGQKMATLRTAQTGVATAIWEDKDPIPYDSQFVIEAKVVGSDPASPPTQYCMLQRTQIYARGPTDIAVMLGAAFTKADTRSNLAFDLTFTLDGTSHIIVSVNDGGIAVMDWKVWLEYRRDT